MSDGDIARRRVVEVPSESTASPGVDSATIVAGLSPVKAATRQSDVHLSTCTLQARLRYHLPGWSPHRLTHHVETLPRTVPPATGSGPIFALNSGPPHAWRRRSSHLQDATSIKFIPLASETSMGAMEPRKSDGKNEETSDILAVASYSSGLSIRI